MKLGRVSPNTAVPAGLAPPAARFRYPLSSKTCGRRLLDEGGGMKVLPMQEPKLSDAEFAKS